MIKANSIRIFLFTLFLSAAAGHVLHAQQTRTLIMAGYKAVPKAQTPATGQIEVTLKGDTLTVEGSFSGLTSYYYGSGIFYGRKDEPGNQIFDLKPRVNDNRTGGTFPAEKNTFVLNQSMLNALSEGELYVAVLSFDHPRGELRVQLPPMQTGSRQDR